MIKLIATDLDGTLINDRRTVPDDFEEIWNILNDNNIVLLAAEGVTFKKDGCVDMKKHRWRP